MVVYLSLRRDSAWTTLPPLLRSARVASIGVTLEKVPWWNVASWRFPGAWATMWLKRRLASMTENSVVRARIDARTKREAAAALKKIGLTLSDAFRLLLVRVAAEKALPFEPLNPNAETVAAMKAARRGELVKVGKLDKLLQSLNARG